MGLVTPLRSMAITIESRLIWNCLQIFPAQLLSQMHVFSLLELRFDIFNLCEMNLKTKITQFSKVYMTIGIDKNIHKTQGHTVPRSKLNAPQHTHHYPHSQSQHIRHGKGRTLQYALSVCQNNKGYHAMWVRIDAVES